MKRKECETYEGLIYIGSFEGYHGNNFTQEDLLKSIHDFQLKLPDLAMPVRISECCYTIALPDKQVYFEKGWEISAIVYPNRPKTPPKVRDFTERLAQHLLATHKQNRVTVRFVQSPTTTVMFEANNAEFKH